MDGKEYLKLKTILKMENQITTWNKSQLTTRSLVESEQKTLQNLCDPAITINLTKVDIEIIKASVSKKFENEDEFRISTGMVIAIVGIKEVPSDFIISECWKIFDHFKSFSIEDYLNAFRFNEMQLSEKKEEHFNSFSPAYMASVLNNYRSIKNKAITDYKLQLAAIAPQPQPEIGEDLTKALKKHYSEHGVLPRFWNWDKVYLYLEETKEIDLTIDEKNKIIEDIKANIEIKKKHASDLSELKDISLLLNKNSLIAEARKICVQNYFNGLK